MTGRDLHPLPLSDALAVVSGQRGGHLVVTMSEGQWDALLSAAYDLGCILLELDKQERPLRAYQKLSSKGNTTDTRRGEWPRSETH